MAFAIFRNETNIDELVARLFSADRNLSKTVAKQAAAALLKANPQLRNMSRLPGGALIIIPDTAPPLIPAEAAQAPAPAFTIAARRVQQQFESLAEQLAVIDGRARDAAKALAELPKVKHTQREGVDLLGLTGILPIAGKPSKAMVRDLENSFNAREEAVSALREHLAALAGITGA